MITPRLVADQQWAGRWTSADEALRQAQGAKGAAPGAKGAAQGAEGEVVRIGGTLVPGLRDHHVHLGLIDRAALGGAALSAVDDLGWVPEEAVDWRRARVGGCTVRVAGPFLTAPGGYPFGRSWAPAGSVAAVGSAEEAAATVDGLVTVGVDMIKVALHTGLPLLDDATLGAIVAAAHRHALPVVAHTEGTGQVVRAAAAGVDVLAHTPWTETLGDDVLQRMAGTLPWISTLAIHDERARVVAYDNLARFVRAGGRVLYGTDMGNGPIPVDLHHAELEALVAAGLDETTILDAVCRAGPTPGVVTWTPMAPPHDVHELAGWCATLRRRRVEDLEGLR